MFLKILTTVVTTLPKINKIKFDFRKPTYVSRSIFKKLCGSLVEGVSATSYDTNDTVN